MKIITSVLAGLLLIGSLGAINSAMAADGILSKDELTPGSYCHERFPAMRQSTLGDDQATLKNSSTGDVIDFYGPCGENPAGEDQIQAQKLENEHRWEMEYSD
jgi:hypothetical protein